MFAAVNFFLAGNARLRSTITISADTQNYTLDVANGGIELMDTGKLSPEAKSAADAAAAGITDGSITVVKLTTKDEVDAAIAAR